jgi:hypothetical protein
MSSVPEFRRKLRALFRRNTLEREMSGALRLRLELQTRENIAAGRPPDEARASS